LIWAASSVRGFNLFFQPPDAIGRAYDEVFALLEHGDVAPVIDRVQPLEDAAAALQHLIEDRPFGKVVLSIDGGHA
jgi:NADPH:quinone reductase-like Zn-dependent oxidoreductase